MFDHVAPIAIASPCVGVCVMGEDWCEGCGRTLDEIAGWTTMGDRKRTAVMAAIPDRLRDPPA